MVAATTTPRFEPVAVTAAQIRNGGSKVDAYESMLVTLPGPVTIINDIPDGAGSKLFEFTLTDNVRVDDHIFTRYGTPVAGDAVPYPPPGSPSGRRSVVHRGDVLPFGNAKPCRGRRYAAVAALRGRGGAGWACSAGGASHPRLRRARTSDMGPRSRAPTRPRGSAGVGQAGRPLVGARQAGRGPRGEREGKGFFLGMGVVVWGWAVGLVGLGERVSGVSFGETMPEKSVAEEASGGRGEGAEGLSRWRRGRGGAGTPVLVWRTAEGRREIEAGRSGLTIARRMFERWRIVGEVDFEKTARVTYRVPEAPADGVVGAVVDVDRTFWPTVFGRGGGGAMGWTKPGEPARLVVAKAPPRRAPVGEPCRGERMKRVAFSGVGLSRLGGGGGGERRFCAWLPKSWAAKPARRYPIVLMFPGLMSNEMAYLRGDDHLGIRLDAISEAMKREVVIVGVDTSSGTGSTYLEDSAANGPWDTFLTERAWPELEKVLRGIPKRTARAVIGQSTGGHNALSYGMRHSDRISVIGASSPDAPDAEAWMFDPGTKRAKAWFRAWAKLEAELGGPGQLVSYAAEWSPDGRSMPFDLESGAPSPTILGAWTAKQPHGMLRDPATVGRLVRDLSGRVMILVGKNDEFELFSPAQSFAQELDAAGVKTMFVATEDGHGNERARLEVALRFALERLAEK